MTRRRCTADAARGVEVPAIAADHAVAEFQRDAEVVQSLGAVDNRVLIAALEGGLHAGVAQSRGERPVAVELSAQRELQCQRTLVALGLGERVLPMT